MSVFKKLFRVARRQNEIPSPEIVQNLLFVLKRQKRYQKQIEFLQAPFADTEVEDKSTDPVENVIEGVKEVTTNLNELEDYSDFKVTLESISEQDESETKTQTSLLSLFNNDSDSLVLAVLPLTCNASAPSEVVLDQDQKSDDNDFAESFSTLWEECY